MPPDLLMFRCAMCGHQMDYVDAPVWCTPKHPHIRCAQCSDPGWAACVHTTLEAPSPPKKDPSNQH